MTEDPQWPGNGPDDEEDEQPDRRICAAAIVHHRLLEDPEYQARRSAVEANARTAPADLPDTVDLTVVVHIVAIDPTLVTDAQVDSQIDVLNRDYSATNSDIGKVPAAFQGVIGNPRFRFTLATTDPDGNATTGITRTTTTKSFFLTSDEGVKFASKGGHDAWDSSRYINLWVCRIKDPMLGFILGYAQFPGGPAATDGVVIATNAFGTMGTAKSPFNLGRTASHEFGHYFDLRHIWGDRVGCLGDDLVADTPQHQKPNYKKPTFPLVTCSNGPAGEMFMNYMDYVDDDTMYMFTQLQVERMRNALSGPRIDLIEETTAVAVTAKAAARRSFSW